MYRELFGFRSRGEPGTRWAEVALVGGRSCVYIWKRGCRCAGVIARIEPPGALSSHNKSAGHSPGSALPPSSFHGLWPVLVIIAQRAHVARRFVHPALLHTRDPTESRLDSSSHLFPPPVIRPTRALETGLVTGGTADLHKSEVAYRRHGGWTGSVADSGGRLGGQSLGQPNGCVASLPSASCFESLPDVPMPTRPLRLLSSHRRHSGCLLLTRLVNSTSFGALPSRNA